MPGTDAYALLTGLTSFVLLVIAPQPVGAGLLGLLFAGHFGFRAVLLWQRTSLTRMAAAFGSVAAFFALLLVSALCGYRVSDIPTMWFGMMASLLVLGVFLVAVESIANRSFWEQHVQRMQRSGLGDILLGRDIRGVRS